MSECLPDLPRYIRPHNGEWQVADHPGGPWRPRPALQPGLPWPVDPSAARQRQALSPTAQAVLGAANGASSYGPDDCLSDAREIAVAVVRTLADHVIGERCQNESERRIYDRLRRVAAELEGADG